MKKRSMFLLVAVVLVTLLAAGCGTTSGTNTASSDSGKPKFPTNTIKLEITHAVGGTVDTAARSIAPYLAKQLGVSVVPENVEGSGGRIARAKVFKDKADGYTILATGMPSAQLGQLLFDGSYKTMDFTFLGNIYGGDSGVIYVNASSNIKTFADLQKLATSGQVNLATGGGFGSSDQLLSLMLRKNANLPHKFIPFNSDSEAVTAVLGNQVTGAFSSLSTVSRFKDKVRILGVFADKRSSDWPDTPTFTELGYKDMISDSDISIVGPPGMPEDVAKTLSDAIAKAAADPEFVAMAQKTGNTLKPLNAADDKKEAQFIYDNLNKYLPDMKAEIANQTK